MISLYTLGGLFYTFAGFSYSLFAIIDISRVKKNKSKYTEEEYKKRTKIQQYRMCWRNLWRDK